MTDVNTITLELHIDEVNSLLNVLGDLPSKTGAWPLMMKITKQAEDQISVSEAPDEISEEA